MLKIKYKGRTFSSSRSLGSAMQRDIQNAYEKTVRQAAAATGVTVRKTSSGLEAIGSQDALARFYRRLGR